MELRHRHVGGGVLRREALLGHEQPGCELTLRSHEYARTFKPNKPNPCGRGCASKFREQLGVPLSCCGFDFSCDVLDPRLFCGLYLLAADVGAAVLISTTLFTARPLQIHTAETPSSLSQRHSQEGLFLWALLPVGYLHRTDTTATALSFVGKKTELSGFLLAEQRAAAMCTVLLHLIL